MYNTTYYNNFFVCDNFICDWNNILFITKDDNSCKPAIIVRFKNSEEHNIFFATKNKRDNFYNDIITKLSKHE